MTNKIIEGSGSLGRRLRIAWKLGKKVSRLDKTNPAALTPDLINKRNDTRARAKAQDSISYKQDRYNKSITKVLPIGGKYKALLNTKFKTPSLAGQGRRDVEWGVKHGKSNLEFGSGTAQAVGSQLQTRSAEINPNYKGKDIYPRIIRLMKNKVVPKGSMAPDNRALSPGAQKSWKKASGHTYDSKGQLQAKGEYDRKKLRPLK